jgi:hypothetical protein
MDIRRRGARWARRDQAGLGRTRRGAVELARHAAGTEGFATGLDGRAPWRGPSGPDRAPAIAVFISTPSQPSSIAIAASDAVPTPASTMTGTWRWSMMIEQIPRVEDAHARADQRWPAASPPRSRSPPGAWRGSGRRWCRPSPRSRRRRASSAAIVCTTSGYSVFGSPSTSSLTRSWPSSSSRARRSVRTASSAV